MKLAGPNPDDSKFYAAHEWARRFECDECGHGAVVGIGRGGWVDSAAMKSARESSWVLSLAGAVRCPQCNAARDVVAMSEVSK